MFLILWDNDVFPDGKIVPRVSMRRVMGYSKRPPINIKNAWTDIVLKHTFVITD